MDEQIESNKNMLEMCDTSSSSNISTLNEANHASTSFTEEIIECEVFPIEKNCIYPVPCTCRQSVQWAWDNDGKSDYVDIVNNNMGVRFHRNFSNGTAIVRCTEPMSNNQYYWEVQMTSPVYGTDIMIGVGTSDAQLKHLQDRFVSFLGMDSKTWGFSYTGLFHHNGQRRCYAESFGQGNIIGVHLDLWKGTLSFYKDRKHLGIASSGLKGKTLYAMASSTAARSGMRIIRSCSFPSSLQFLCCTKLRELIPDDKNVLDAIDIPSGLKLFLENKLSWLLEKRYLEQKIEHICTRDESLSDEEVSEVEEFPLDNRNSDLLNVRGQFLLLGSVLFRNHNRYQQTIRDSSQVTEIPSEQEAKRRRCSYDCSLVLSDNDSD